MLNFIYFINITNNFILMSNFVDMIYVIIFFNITIKKLIQIFNKDLSYVLYIKFKTVVINIFVVDIIEFG